jgi:hypothetical protein
MMGVPPREHTGKVKGHYVCVLFQVLECNIAFSLRLAVTQRSKSCDLFTQTKRGFE